MGISKYNAEGYYDPTAYEALTKIENEKKLQKKMVFICSPYAGDIEVNTTRAKRYGRFAVKNKTVPIIPHLMYPQFLDEENQDERRLGLEMGLELLSKCQEMWVFGDYISSGMSAEIKSAKKWNIHIRYFTMGCEEMAGGK